MMPLEFQASGWYQAVTLKERLASLRAAPEKLSKVEINHALAERRLQRWRSQPPFTTDAYFEQRLAINGMTEDELRYLLGEPIEAVRDRFSEPPSWLVEIAQAFARNADCDRLASLEILEDYDTPGFLSVIEPLISQGLNRLQEGVQTLQAIYSDSPYDPNTIEEVLSVNLPGQLLAMLDRTMVLELNVARLQGFLSGDTAEERFESFVQRLKERDTAIALLHEYPVLARQLKIRIDHWVAFSLEFLHHLCADWKAICTTLSSGIEPGVLVQIDGGDGDQHEGGRSVLIAEFSSGFQVVYKPRSLVVDVHFQELLTWINQRGHHPPFRTLQILDRGTYSWVEFVDAYGCTSSEEVQRFYQRQGGYLALLYAIQATDFHHENLIAAGEHPVLIDLESLFHAIPKGIEVTEVDELAFKSMAYSVIRVGLLPERNWADDEYEGADVSGLGGREGQLSPERLLYWEGIGTDEMRLIRERKVMEGKQNRPNLNGAEVDLLNYTEALVDGFTNIYQLLLKHRDELLSEDGPLAHFAQDPVRAILRGTRIYSRLLEESFHPDVLRNALDRDRLLDRLWGGIEDSPDLVKVIPAELDDLQQGDIPMFGTRPNSCDLWSSSNQQIPNMYAQSGLELVKNHIQQLSIPDLERQLWFISASLTTLCRGVDPIQQQPYGLSEPETTANSEQLYGAAQAIGDRLAALALRSENYVNWLGLTLEKDRYWSLIPLGLDLYDGLPGVALFLAHLGAITQEARYSTLAQTTLATMRHQWERRKSSITWIGGFDGWGGMIYTLTQLAMVWNEPALLTEAEATVDLLLPLIEQDERLDITTGAAGCIGSLITLYRCTSSEQVLAAAIQCGDHLIARAQPMKVGCGWVVPGIAKMPLAGFSHGAAGIAWALLELAVLTGFERFQTTAQEAIAYERSLFVSNSGNWLDLREADTLNSVTDSGDHDGMTAWCHGAPGIGLARLQCLQHMNDDNIRTEIDTALKTTLEEGFGSSHSLCHGDLGNLELLLQASEIFDDPQLRLQVNRLTTIILDSIHQHGWLCGNPLGVESPGLMTGLAGIGYELLRLADPQRVPSVLVLEPPKLNLVGANLVEVGV